MSFRVSEKGPRFVELRSCGFILGYNPMLMDWNEYCMVDSLGKGAQGEVFRLRHIISNNYIAVKISPNTEDKREIEIMQKINHLNIIKLLGVECTPKTQFVYLEYLEGETVFNLMRKRRRWSLTDFLPVYIQIFKALEYLQSMNIAHMDLKFDNIMVLKTGIVKIIDFGNSIDFSRYRSVTNPIGSFEFGAPEMNLGVSFHGFPFDVFTLHVVLGSVTLGKCLWAKAHERDPTYSDWLRYRFQSSLFRGLDPDLFQFLKRVLVHDPSQRPSLSQIREDPWFKNMILE